MGFSLFLIFLAAVNLSYGFPNFVFHARANLGEDAILPCDLNIKQDVTELRWRQTDLGILLLEYENGKIQFKHANYTNRIYLLDPELKRGNSSLVLKKVAMEDDGQYECEAVCPRGEKTMTYNQKFWFEVVPHTDVSFPCTGGSGSPVKLFLPALMFSLLMAMILL